VANREDGCYHELRNRVEHVSLSADPEFQDVFTKELSFSERAHTYQEGIAL